MRKQTLIFDADDTLWENGVYFENAVQAFIALVDHAVLSPAEIRAAVDRVELATVKQHGYGPDGFELSLRLCWNSLHDVTVTPDDIGDRIATMCDPLRDMEIALIEGVAETLAELAEHHHLYLLTKGSERVQRRKIERSLLTPRFVETVVVPEKTTEVYDRFVASRSLSPDDTWMIGNSPRSDILPALEAGLGAVLVPHPVTWSLDAAELPDPGPRFRVASGLSEVASMFRP
jgi:putative hydrolase of the HAD superfamily